MSNLALEYDDEIVEAEVAEAEAPAPRMIIVDKRLAEALSLLGVNVYE